MESRSDEELIEVVTGAPDDWQPEALQAARTEIARRGLVFDSPAVEARDAPAATEKGAGPPLHANMKAVALILGLVGAALGLVVSVLCVLVALAVMATRKRMGRGRAAAEFAAWTAIGAAVAFVFVFATR